MSESLTKDAKCGVCMGIGWVLALVDEDETVTTIERCPTCNRYQSDEQAKWAFRQEYLHALEQGRAWNEERARTWEHAQ